MGALVNMGGNGLSVALLIVKVNSGGGGGASSKDQMVFGV